MSKPNPAITANLLNTILDKRGEHFEEGGGKAKVASESAPKAPNVKSKPAPGRKNAGAGRMRSSPRGK